MTRKIIISIVLVLGFLGFSGFAKTKSDIAFEFPFQVGDSIWNTFDSNKSRIEALQIPDSELCNISSDRLLNLCLDYPYNFELFCYRDFQKGCKDVFEMFNGYTELFSREDLTQVVIQYLKEIPDIIDNICVNNLYEQGELSLKYKVLFNIISICKNRCLSEKLVQIINESQIKVISKMIDNPKIFSNIGISYSDLLANEIENSSERPTYVVWKLILPNKQEIEVLRWTNGELSEAEKEFSNRIVESFNGIIIMEATNKYNCHGYAWYMYPMHIGDPVWIDHPDLYWQTGCYYEVPEKEAQIIVYAGDGDVTHSAVRIDSNEYISKWGNMPLVKHSPANVPPNYGQPFKYYKTFPIPFIIGPETIKNEVKYSVRKLPSNFRVQWTISDKYYAQNCMVVNDTICTIIEDKTRPLENASLIARIFVNDRIGWTIEKKISTENDFSAIIYNINWDTQRVLTYPYIIYAKKGDVININSNSFINATASYEGDIIPSRWNWDKYSGKLTVSLPLNDAGSALVLHITCEDGTKYDIIILKRDSRMSLHTFMEGDYLTLNVSQTIDNFVSELKSRNCSKLQNNQKYDVPKIWEVEIVNTLTSALVYSGTMNQNNNTIDTSIWLPGIYFIKVKIGDIMLEKKVTIE